MTKISRWTLTAALALAAGAATLIAQPPATQAPSTSPAVTVPAEAQGQYTRVVEHEDGSLTLEIAAKTFTPKDGKGPKVHLVGAVHVGDKTFYGSLQQMLDACDLVLFEGVKPPGAGSFDSELDEAGKIKATKARLQFLLKIVDDERSRNGKLPESLAQAVEDAGKRWKTMIASSLTDAWGRPIQYTLVTGEAVDGGDAPQHALVTSLGPDGQPQDGKGDDIREEGKATKKKAKKDVGLQAKMADALGLTFQLDAMDSSKPNWRSSDMSIDQLQARFAASGADGDQLFKMLDGSSIMGQLASLALGLVKSSPQLAATVKLMMVDMLGNGDVMNAGPAEMQKLMSVIVVDRNDVVLKDLRAVIDTESRKDVAIFYGAGHLQDMEAKLRKDFGYVAVPGGDGETWFPAITVNPKAAGLSAKEAQSMRDMMKRQLASQAEAEQKKAERAKAKKEKKDKDAQKEQEPAPAMK
ncbi:MAG: hypothetical protein QM783_14760 [Phycisphaerales bacterium]